MCNMKQAGGLQGNLAMVQANMGLSSPVKYDASSRGRTCKKSSPEQETMWVLSVPVKELCGLFSLQIVLQYLKKKIT